MISLRKRTVAGLTWTALSQIGGQVIQLVTAVFLTRRLLPTDFGTAGLALTITTTLAALSQLGMSAGLVQRRHLATIHYTTAFSTTTVLSLLLGLLMLVGAGPAAHLFKNPALAPVLRLYSVMLILGDIAAIQSALLVRFFDFRSQARAALVARFIGGVTSVLLASAGFGAMSIAWGYVALTVVNAALLLRPCQRLSKTIHHSPFTIHHLAHAFGQLFGFGSGIMAANLLDQLTLGLDIVLVAKMLGPAALGYYSLAAQTGLYLARSISAVLGTVLFPALVEVYNKEVRSGEYEVRSFYLRLANSIALGVLPLVTIVIVIAPQAVPLLYGTGWTASVRLLQLLVPYGFLLIVLDALSSSLFKALGQSRRLLVISTVRCAGIALAVCAGSRFGLTGVAVSLLCCALLYRLGTQVVVNRTLNLTMSQYGRALAVPLFSAAVSGTAVTLLGLAIPGLVGPGIGAVLIRAGATGLGYLVIGQLLAPREFQELVRTLGLSKFEVRLSHGAGGTGASVPRCRRHRCEVSDVCVITTVHSSDDVRIFHKEILTLRSAGYRVTFIAPQKFGGNQGGRRLWRMLLAPVRVGLPALRTRCRTYHLHDPELLPLGIILKLLGKRVIYDIHEDYPEQMMSKHYLAKPLRRLIGWAIGLLEQAAVRFLDGTIAATEAIAARFPKDRITLVRNYPTTRSAKDEVRSAEFPSVLGNLSTRAQGTSARFPTNRFRLIHLSGTLTEERGITTLVQALALLDDHFELILGGRFVTPEYEKRLRTLSGFTRVRYIGTIPHQEVFQWYRQADAGVVPSLPLRRHQSALPVKMFEFMAAGLPVLVADLAVLRKIIEEWGCGICINPLDPKTIAAAARFLASNPDICQAMGAAGRTAVRKQYNWWSEAQNLLRLYRRLTPLKKEPPRIQGFEDSSLRVGGPVVQ